MPAKKRTGSAYGISVAVTSDAIEAFIGAVATFTRTGDSDQEVEYDFCPNCGTTIRWRVARMPNCVVFAGGALDDMAQVTIGGEMYTKDALPWARLGCEITCSSAPDESFRAELAQRAAQGR
jgi:hypothetical protein